MWRGGGQRKVGVDLRFRGVDIFPGDYGGGRFSKRFMEEGGLFSERLRGYFSHRNRSPLHINNEQSSNTANNDRSLT